MSVSRVEVPLPHNGVHLSEMRPEVEAALQELPVGMVKYRWDGDVVRFTAPGTDGRIFVEDGRICAQAKLRFPASLFRRAIMEQAKEGLEQLAESVKSAGGE